MQVLRRSREVFPPAEVGSDDIARLGFGSSRLAFTSLRPQTRARNSCAARNSLVPANIPDSLSLATDCAPGLRFPRAQRSRCRAHSRPPSGPAQCADKPVESVPALVWNALGRFGDLAFHGTPWRSDERGRRCRAAQRLVGDSRKAIHCPISSGSKTSPRSARIGLAHLALTNGFPVWTLHSQQQVPHLPFPASG
jgi:hypothetical protein